MTWTAPAFEALATLVSARTGLAFAPDRRAGAEIGMRRALARAGASDPERYGGLVAADDRLFDDLIVELTVGETYFFREPAQFEFIRRTVLPAARPGPDDNRPLRAWSAGCASGEEAYSLAMLFADTGWGQRSHVLATDISRAALERSRRGSYNNWSLRGEGAAQALPHLVRAGERYVVTETIRQRVTIETLNLALDIYPEFANGTWNLDLIFCRNVLIYLDHATIRAIAGRFFSALAEGGWLVTASSDPPLGDAAPFEIAVTDSGIYYRKPVARVPIVGPSGKPPDDAIPATRPPRSFPAPKDEGIPSPSPRREGAPRLSEEATLAAARADLVAGQYARAAEQARPFTANVEAAALRVRALANLDPDLAERDCIEALARHPFSCELHHLRAVILVALGRDAEAARVVRRTLYLDRSLAIAHFLLGSILRRLGDQTGSWRSYRNARDLAAARPADEVVPLSDGEPAGRIADIARTQVERLEPVPEVRP